MLSDDERKLVEQVAIERGVSVDEAASQLVSEALSKRVRRKTRRAPASNVRQFTKRAK